MTVDANTASREELIALASIREEIADAIIRARPFDSIDDLLSIPGIGPRSLERLKAQGLIVEVGGTTRQGEAVDAESVAEDVTMEQQPSSQELQRLASDIANEVTRRLSQLLSIQAEGSGGVCERFNCLADFSCAANFSSEVEPSAVQNSQDTENH